MVESDLGHDATDRLLSDREFDIMRATQILHPGRTPTMEFKSKKFKERNELKAGENLCEFCTGKCCRYYAFPITTPKDWEDFDFIRWYLLHGRTSIFVDEGTWHILVSGDCQHLLEDNRCGIYHTRPQICRDHTTDDCEYDSDADYDQLFETAEQIEEFAEAMLPANKRAPWSRDRQHTLALPIVS
jgi:Fe-S-cluster containining protein